MFYNTFLFVYDHLFANDLINCVNYVVLLAGLRIHRVYPLQGGNTPQNSCPGYGSKLHLTLRRK